MRNYLLLAIALIAVAFLLACNKQKPPKLDYTEKMQKGVFSNHGLPGDGYVGRTPEEDKFHGFHEGDGKKPEEKKPEEKKPEAEKTD